MKKVNRVFLALLAFSVSIQADRFETEGKIVHDSKTELYWQSNPSSSKFTWDKAQNYCNDLSYGGYNDWRLPNLYELKSLVDYSKYNPAIATTIINIKIDDYYWSSSKDISDSSRAWFVNFDGGNGSDFWFDKSDEGYALCVRGQ